MKLKVCGVTDPAFAVEAARRGIDYLGLIFAEKSPRRVSVERAREIAQAVVPGGGRMRSAASVGLPRFVGVFAGHAVEDILAAASAVPLDVIQLHGAYGADAVLRLRESGCEVWALRQEGEYPPAWASADAVLLDGRDGARCGGTGKRADWSLVAELKRAGRRVVLAGGLSAANIAEAAATGADVLDVNSGVETSPGVKSIQLLDELANALGGWKKRGKVGGPGGT